MPTMLALLLAVALPLAANTGAGPTVTSSMSIFEAGYANYSQFRIPALLVIPKAAAAPAAAAAAGGSGSTAAAAVTGDVVLAFAEARGPNHQQACDTCNTRITMRRSTDGGSTFGPLQEITKAHPTKGKDWTGNAVPLWDAGNATAGRKPSVTMVYSHDNNYILYVRSLDLGQTWGSPVNISAAAHPPGVAYAPEDYFTGPGGGIQLKQGPHAGRLVVPAIATYTNASAASCAVGSPCWAAATHDHVLFSDDGVTWQSGTASGGIPGCGASGVQCGDEFQVTELRDGSILGVSRHPGGPALTVSTDQGASFSTGPMRVLATIPSPSCQTSLLNAGDASGDKLLISAPFGSARSNMTLSTGTATGEWSAVLQLSASAKSYAGYSALAQLSSGSVLCMWEGPCSAAQPNELAEFCLATIAWH